MRAILIDPRDQSWQCDSPAYRIIFWQSAGGRGSPGWRSDEWEITEADIDEVLAWAGSHAAGRPMSIWVVHRDAAGLGLIRLAGIDPVADRDGWPS